MRVLIVSPITGAAGGIKNWTINTVNYFNKDKSIDISIIDSSLVFGRIIENSFLRIFQGILTALSCLFQSIPYLFNPSIKVVHINTSLSYAMIRDIISIYALKLLGKYVIIHIRVGTISNSNESELFAYLKGLILTKADSVICLDQPSYSFIKENYKCDIHFVPNPIPEIFSSNTGKDNYTLGNLFQLIYVGRITSKKGIPNLVKACIGIENIELTIIGPSDLKMKLELEEVIEKHNLNVKLLGEVPRHSLIQYYNNSDLFVLPSYTEGFPNVILEAASLGIPIITTDVGNAIDMISYQTETLGIIVKKGEVVGLKNAIEDLRDNYEEYSKKSIRLKGIIKVKYSEKVVYNQLSKIWRSALRTKKEY